MPLLGFLITMVASYFLNAALKKKPQEPTPAAAGDFSFPQASEGTAMTVFFGDNWSEDWMVLGVTNYRTSAIKSGGGKK